jgi:hypothetical protein
VAGEATAGVAGVTWEASELEGAAVIGAVGSIGAGVAGEFTAGVAGVAREATAGLAEAGMTGPRLEPMPSRRAGTMRVER